MTIAAPDVGEDKEIQRLSLELAGAEQKQAAMAEELALLRFRADRDPLGHREELEAKYAEQRYLQRLIGDTGRALYQRRESRRVELSRELSGNKEFHTSVRDALIDRSERFTAQAAMMAIYARMAQQAVHLSPSPPAPISAEWHWLQQWAQELIRLGIAKPGDLPAWLRQLLEAER